MKDESFIYKENFNIAAVKYRTGKKGTAGARKVIYLIRPVPVNVSQISCTAHHESPAAFMDIMLTISYFKC